MLRGVRAAVAVASLGAGLVLAAATPAAADTELVVEAGYGGAFTPGRPVPVRVVVTADRLVRGTLELVVTGGFGAGTTTTVPVEVPGGSVKELVVVIPTTQMSDSATIRASLVAGGEGVSESAAITFRAELEVVGLLAGVTPTNLPGAVPLDADLGSAELYALDEGLLAAAPGSLAALGTVVAGPGDFADLPEPTRRALLAWVGGGGRLVFDTPAGSEIDGLPDAWQPGDRQRLTAGLGEIRVSDGAAAAGRWSDVLEPTPHLSPQEAQGLSSGWFPFEAVGDTVARDAGLELAQLGWLLGFLILYVAIVGPVTFLVLRGLRRPDLAWVAIPLLAVLFVGVSWLAGSDLRQGTRAAHGSVVVSGPQGSSATSVVGVVSRNGGDGRVSFPRGWTAGTVDTSFFGGVGNAAAVSPTADGVEGRVGLEAGQFGVVAGEGLLELEGGLVVEAVSSEDRVARGTVRNTTDLTLRRVGVIVGRAGVHVGDLAPGEEKEWEIRTGPGTGDSSTPPEALVWPAEAGYSSEPRVDTVVALPLLTQAGFSNPMSHPAGMAVAVGWTRDFRPPLTATGGDDLGGRAAIIGRGLVEPAGPDLTDMVTVRELLRGPQGVRVAGRGDLPEQFAVFRFVLTGDMAGGAGPLHIDVPAYVSRVEVWSGDAWVEIDASDELGFNGGDPYRVHEVDLPAGTVHDGIVYTRVGLRLDFGSFDGDRLMVGDGAAA